MRNRRSGCGRERQPRFAGVLFALTLCANAAWSQAQLAAPLPALSATQVVGRLTEKNRERAATLAHYSSVRSYRLEYKGFPTSADATMVVNVSCDAGVKRFTVVSSTGSKLIESRVFARLLESEQQAGDVSNRSRTELGPENYDFSLAGVDGTNYILNVAPKVESKFLYKGKIWVDGHDFAVIRIEAQPARNPSFWTTQSLIEHTYQKVDGGFYLPKENKTVTSVRMGGTATLTIQYKAYQVTAAPPPASAKKATGPGDGSVWPDGGFTVAMASFANSRK